MELYFYIPIMITHTKQLLFIEISDVIVKV